MKNMYKFKFLQTPWLLLGLVITSFFIALMLYVSPIANAATNGTESCSTKINEDNCNKAVEDECTSISPDRRDDCRKNTIGRFKDKPGATSGSTPLVVSNGENAGEYYCGNGDKIVTLKFDLGCLGTKYPGELNPITDMLFAFIRFLSLGVGVVVVIAIIMAGIQYTTSEGNPETTAEAKRRIRYALIALVTYMFIFSLLQYLVPGGLFNKV